MWHPTSKTKHMEEHVTEHDKKNCDDECTTGNVDSGFLSAGNLQFSGEIRDSGLLQQEQEGQEREGEQPITLIPLASSVTTTVSSSSTVSEVIKEEPMRVTDSGVDLDLSENMSQLCLQQVCLNPLSGRLIHSDPTVPPELLPTSGNLSPDNSEQGDDKQNHKQQNVNTTANKPLWQLYYMQDDDGDTQLHMAIVQGYFEAATCLIRMAPDPCLLDIMNDNWQSPLHLAVLTHQSQIVRNLVLAGADLTVRNFSGNTALHLACKIGNLACAEALTVPLSPMERQRLKPLQKVPALPQDLEERNNNGEMCLHIAAYNGHVSIVRHLLRLGANPKAREGLEGKTALHLAMERPCWSVILLLLQECKPCLETPTYAGLTAYQLALTMDKAYSHTLIKNLVRSGAMPKKLPISSSESDSESSDDDD